MDARAPYARDYPDPQADLMPPLVLDRQRIVRCSAFRRLGHKTQVFIAAREDHFRTRLTHTLEVAHTARRIMQALDSAPGRPARALACNPPGPGPEDCALAEVVALAHDLGHPPFGHAGERALNECMADFGGFEHNAQALRVVEYLEHPYPAFRGLNLTRIVRECLARHTTPYDHPRGGGPHDGAAPPLPGQVVALADRFTYCLHDLEDGVYAGLIDPAALEAIELWREAFGAPAETGLAGVRRRLRPVVDRILDRLIEDLVQRSVQRAEPLAWPPSGAGDAQPSGLGGHPGPDPPAARPVLALSVDLEQELAALEKLLESAVYRDQRIARMDSKARRIVRGLFQAYVDEPQLMPRRWAQRVAQQGAPRVACDYLAGMTDRFCLREYARIFGSSPEV